MKLSPALHVTLTRLNAALLEGRQDALEQCLADADLEVLLSQDTLAKVRARGKIHMCNFLCTLAVANEVEAPRAQVWLDVYHSLSTGALREGLERLPANNVLRQMVEARIRKSSLGVTDLKNTKGSERQWQDAFELSVDTRDWVSAVSLLQTLGAKRIETKRWLLIARALTERQPLLADVSGIAHVDIDYERLAQLYEICTSAARNAKAHEVVRALNFVRAACLETGGKHAAAIELLRPLDKGAEAQKTKIAIARNLCKSGDLPGSIAQLDLALQAFEYRNAGKTGEAADAGIQAARETAATFDVARASRTLSDLAQIFRDNGLKLFLVSGTLLGYEREGKLLDHDKDIDVGVVGWENQYDICLALQKSGVFTVDAKFLKGARTYYIPIAHNITGMYTDLFIYEPRDDKLVTGVDFFFGYRQTFAFTPFELKPVNFLGVDMYVPQDTALNLEENFGNWRVPDASYISHLESPSTVNKGALPFMLTARITALGALMDRKPKKLRKVIAVLREHAHFPQAMSPQLLEKLEQACIAFEGATPTFTGAASPAREEVYA